MVGVILKGEPVPTAVPPHEPEYHCHLDPTPREPPVEVKVIGVPEQTVVDGLTLTEVGSVEEILTVTELDRHKVVLQDPSARTK